MLAALSDAAIRPWLLPLEARPGLEERACVCYAVVKEEYGRLLPDLMAT